MRYGSLLTVLILFGVSLRSAADDPPPPAAAAVRDDAPVSGVQVKVFTVRSGDAVARAEMLRLVLGQGSSGMRPIQIAADQRTNNIIAVGTVGDLEIIRAVLARLDDPTSYLPQVEQHAPPKLTHTRPLRSNDQAGRSQTIIVQQESPGTPVSQEVKEAELHWKSAKAELERRETLRQQPSAAFSSSEMARARLAVRSAEAQLEQCTKPTNERPKIGFKP